MTDTNEDEDIRVVINMAVIIDEYITLLDSISRKQIMSMLMKEFNIKPTNDPIKAKANKVEVAAGILAWRVCSAHCSQALIKLIQLKTEEIENAKREGQSHNKAASISSRGNDRGGKDDAAA